jgi:hypothetical protein
MVKAEFSLPNFGQDAIKNGAKLSAARPNEANHSWNGCQIENQNEDSGG